MDIFGKDQPVIDSNRDPTFKRFCILNGPDSLD